MPVLPQARGVFAAGAGPAASRVRRGLAPRDRDSADMSPLPLEALTHFTRRKKPSKSGGAAYIRVRYN